MTEGARPPLDVQIGAQIVLDQQERTRAALAEIGATGDLTEFGEKVFHWMILGIDRDDAGLSRRRARIFSALDAELEARFGTEGRQEVARAVALIAEDVRAVEMAPAEF